MRRKAAEPRVGMAAQEEAELREKQERRAALGVEAVRKEAPRHEDMARRAAASAVGDTSMVHRYGHGATSRCASAR
eukprot:6197294-Pleurochrysis_carterae.AAC.1